MSKEGLARPSPGEPQLLIYVQACLKPLHMHLLALNYQLHLTALYPTERNIMKQGISQAIDVLFMGSNAVNL